MIAAVPVDRTRRGRWAEEVAAGHLVAGGLRTVKRNYRCKWGEIDLVMRDRDTLVFVEVRFRNRHDFGDGAESVDPHKQRKLVAAAEHYLQSRSGLRAPPCRFDVVSVSPGTVKWIKDAFNA